MEPSLPPQPAHNSRTVAKKNAALKSAVTALRSFSGLCSVLCSSVSVTTTTQAAPGLVPTKTVLIRSRIDDPRDSHWLDAAPGAFCAPRALEHCRVGSCEYGVGVLYRPIGVFDFCRNWRARRATHVIDRNPRALVFSEVIYHAWKKIGKKKAPPRRRPRAPSRGAVKRIQSQSHVHVRPDELGLRLGLRRGKCGGGGG